MWTVRRLLLTCSMAAAALLSGCSTSPKAHAESCQTDNPNAPAAVLECTQQRMRADSRTKPVDMARVDFLVGARRSLAAKVDSGAMSKEQATATLNDVARQLDQPDPSGTYYIDQATLDACCEKGREGFNAYVRPRRTQAYSTAGGAGTSGSSPSNDAPCVTGYCGPVSVQGYYRKDGTYVRPHTRSAPRSGGRR